MTPTDVWYSSQWHLGIDVIGDIEAIWDEFSGAGIHVGVFDSGVDVTHVDLAGGYDASLNFEYLGVEDPVTPVDPMSFTDSHGTAVAGLIVARNNGEGVVGVAWGATFTSINIMPYINTDEAHLLEAIRYHSAFDVVNDSWQWTGPLLYFFHSNLAPTTSMTYARAAAFEYASQVGRNGLGTVIVQGSANDAIETQGNGMATARHTITVGAHGPDGFVSTYANHGATLLVSAPSAADITADPGLITTDITGDGGYNDDPETADYTRFGGTSGSGPIVSGIAALMLDANPNLGWRDVQNILAASATHSGSAFGGTRHANENSDWFFNSAADWNGGGMHYSNDYGYGAVNAYNAVRMAEVWSLFQPTAQTSANETTHPLTWNWGGDNANSGIAFVDGGVLNDSLILDTGAIGLRVEHVEVRLVFEHSNFSQLRMWLISPEGTEVQVLDGTGASDAVMDTLGQWIFGADALRGELAAGEWKIRIEDTEVGETGYLWWFEVMVWGEGVDTSASSRNDTCHYTDEFLAMTAIAGETGRGILSDAGGVSDWIDMAAVTGNVALNLNVNQNTTVNGAFWFFVSGGTQIEDAVTGDGDDALVGNGAANRLYGMRGNDVLEGGGGTDTLNGGVGNDVFLVASPSDFGNDTLLGENGTDRIRFTSTTANQLLILSAGVTGIEIAEIATAAGSFAGTVALSLNAALVGAALQLFGNNGNNTLTGTAFTDVLNGRFGDDTYNLGSGNDTVQDTGGSDTITSTIDRNLANFAAVEKLVLLGAAINGTGNAIVNTITGNGANNVLNGGADNVIDTLIGGLGNDTYQLGAGNDTVTEAAGNTGGIDTATSTIGRNLSVGGLVNVENLILLGAGTATGNNLNNVLDGSQFAGVNALVGGLGNDTYQLGAGNDTVTEAAGNTGGIDTATSTIGRNLSIGGLVNVENLILLGAGLGTGNGLNNSLDGSQSVAANELRGLAGNDVYTIGAGDVVNETIAGSAGVDTVRAAVSHALGANVENLVLIGTAVNGIGNGLANAMTGNAGANSLNGAGGNDTINGAGGTDTINGSLGNDTLVGGLNDDLFVLNTAPGAANIDLITDLNEAGNDTIWLENTGGGLFNALALGALALNAYTENMAGIATATTHRIIYEIDTGILRYDSNGSAAGGIIVHFATLDANKAAIYSNADFLVI